MNRPGSIRPSCVRINIAQARKKGGRSRGGLSTKIHATVDALGNPTGFHLTPGQAHDLEGADALLPNNEAQALIADKAYDAQDRAISPLENAGKGIVIPSRISSTSSSNIAPSLPATTKLLATFSAQSTSPPLSFGSIDDTP
jgi:uncharacterized protein YgbK (DUF1537 family)